MEDEKVKSKDRFSKFIKWIYLIVVNLLALVALFLIGVAVASKLKFTNVDGMKDVNSRYFSEMAGKYNQNFAMDSVAMAKQQRLMYQNIGLLLRKYPYNAKIILQAYDRTKDINVAMRMLDAVNLELKDDKEYQSDLAQIKDNGSNATLSIYPWVNSKEWQEFRKVIRRDTVAIDSVAKITGVEARLIVTCVVGEQIRMFNSMREKFKQAVLPYNHIFLPRNRGYGVSGILEHTAYKIEANLFNKNSPFYPGDYFQRCLNLKDSFPDLVVDTIEAHHNLTIQRLMEGGTHYYSYLYTAFLIRQYQAQWEKAGYSLAHRPEIIATLFNLGYQKSKPGPNPQVGGSNFKVGDKDYTFGGLCYEFYYSGELQDIFPLTSRPFTPVEELERTIVLPDYKKMNEEAEKKQKEEAERKRLDSLNALQPQQPQ